MFDNDYFLEDEEDEDIVDLSDGEEDEEGEQEEEDIGEEIKEEAKQKSRAARDAETYGDKMSASEIWLSSAYDDIQKAAKKKEGVLDDVVTTIIMANPVNTSAATRSVLVKEALNKQGHARIVSTMYVPDSALRGEDIDMDILDDDNSSFNALYAREARDKIAEFVKYLSTRDLSKDSTISKRRKMRQLPAFIIYLFANGMYDLIINCPTMPPEYQKQIDNALNIITKEKYRIVEDLARAYDEAGRDQVADRVRKLGLNWFAKEPNEIRTTGTLSDLNLTADDVAIYKSYRGQYTNASKAITQDFISDLIEVVIDPEAMVYERLKDKTRADAIADVKDVLDKWSADNAQSSELAKKVIWGDPELKNI